MHKKSSFGIGSIITILVILAAAAGAYYYLKGSHASCKEVCAYNDDGIKECAVVCESGATAETAAKAEEAAQADL